MRLRPYKSADAETILTWVRDEDTFRKWVTDRYPVYPITAADMNRKYLENNGDCPEPDNFYPMTAFDGRGILGHLIMRFTDAEKTAWNAKSNFSGSYNDLTNKPTIPSVDGLATTSYVDKAVANIILTSESGKKFKLTVDDTGALTATEVVE